MWSFARKVKTEKRRQRVRKKEGTKEDVCVDGLMVASSTINVAFGTVSFAPVVVGPQERHAAALIIISYSEA